MRVRLRALVTAAVVGTATIFEPTADVTTPPAMVRLAPDQEGIAERLRKVGLRFGLYAVP